MSVRQATKRKNPQKKGSKRQNNSSNSPVFKSSSGNGQMKLYKKPLTQINQASAFKMNTEPKIQTVGGTTVISHSEMVMQITKSAATSGFFQMLGRLRVNPGSAATFRWLSTLALSWESYKFKKLQFRFLTRSSTTTNGSLILSPDYDSADGVKGNTVAVTEAELFSNVDSIDLPVYTDQIVCVLDPRRMNRLFKAHSCMSDGRFATTAQDSKTIDPAQLYVASDAAVAGAAQIYGKLVVDYIVEFYEPQARTEVPTAGGFAAAANNGQLSIVSPSTAIFAAPFPAWDAEAASPPISFAPLLSGVQYPSPIIGRFLRDWQGPISTNLLGAGLSNFSNFFVGPNNGPIDGFDTPQTANTAMRLSTATGQSQVDNIIGPINYYLKMQGPAIAATLTGFHLAAGGAGFPEIL